MGSMINRDKNPSVWTSCFQLPDVSFFSVSLCQTESIVIVEQYAYWSVDCKVSGLERRWLCLELVVEI